MSNSKKLSVVSMLVREDSLILFTVDGEMMPLEVNSYNIEKAISYLTDRLTGSNVVEIGLEGFFAAQDFSKRTDGMICFQTVDGKEIKGTFYPDEEVVAKVSGKIITKVQNLSKQIERANRDNSKGVQHLLERVALVIDDRLHSAEDLMNFLGTADLPIADNGDIICYKKLTTSSNKNADYVDTYSKKILQNVGSLVSMDPKDVDSSRNNSCSYGLHVANLGYIGQFTGQHVIMVRVRPEDFIAVPHHESTKARVCAYHILGELSHDGCNQINQHKQFDLKSIDGVLLANALSGNHEPPFEQVMIIRQGEIKVTSMNVNLANPENELRPNMPPEVVKAFNLLMLDKPVKSQIAKAVGTSPKSLNRWMKKWGFEAYTKAAINLTKTGNITAAPLTAPGKTYKPKNLVKGVRKSMKTTTNVAKAVVMLKKGMTKAAVARELNTNTRTLGRWIDKYSNL